MADFGTRVELQIGETWTDVTDDVMGTPGIKHTRGRPDEGARVDPSACNLTLRSPNGLYSGRNPNSRNFGLLGRNTPMRVSVDGEAHLYLPGGTNRVTTPDASALDIVGDIDIRIEAALTSWRPDTDTELAGKWTGTGTLRSWLMTIIDGKLRLFWSPDGTASLSALSTAQVGPPMSGRLAVRVTLDVDNGAGGRTVTFYTAPTLAGPWTMLGTPRVIAGTTSIFASAAPVDLGSVGSVGFPDPTGRYYKAEIRNGIGGAIVANPDFTVQTPGATSFTDGAGRVWSTAGGATISDRAYRFTGEVSAWPPRWHLSGNNVQAPVQAAGVLRRLGQGAKALDSTLRRRVPSAANLLAYWPLEEGADADGFAASPVPGVKPLSLTRVQWAAADTLPSSNPLPVFNSAGGELVQMRGNVPAPAGTPTGWQVRWVYRLDTPNTTRYTFMRILTTGTVREWYIQAKDTESRVLGVDIDGATVVDQLIATSLDLYNQWTTDNFNLSQSGGTVTWQILWQDVGGDAGQFTSTYSGTIGRVTAVTSPSGGFGGPLDGMALGHIAVFSSSTTNAFDGAITAYTGETAGTRATRLAEEESIPFRVAGGTDGQTLVGPQTPRTVLDLLGEAEQADGGILCEDRDHLGLVYRSRPSLYNQTPALTVSYGQLTQPFDPIDDDSRIRNDVTVVRDGGSSSRVQITEGPLSVAAPPSGVGIYDESVTLSLNTDSQTEPIAGWLAHLGTVDEARYQSLTLMLHKYPSLVPAVLALDIGDVVRVTDLPPHLPPGPVDLLVEGYTEDIGPKTWTLVLVCSPASPWQVGVEGDPVYARADTAGSALASSATATATTLSVATTVGPVWVTAAPNEISDPGFEQGTGAWVCSRGSTIGVVSWERAIVHSGSGAARMTRTHATDTGSLNFIQSGVTYPAAAGQTWKATAWVYNGSATPRDHRMGLVWRNASAVDTFILGTVVTATVGSWYQITVSGTLPAGAVAVYPSVVGVSGWTVGEWWITDDVRCARTDTLVGTDMPDEFPFPVTVGGEVVNVHGISGTTSPQTFYVNRSVNGIVKAQASGTDLRLTYPTIAAL